MLNGLMESRGAGLVAAKHLRMGLIPAGSTDAVVCSIYGSRCARTAAAHICLGGAQPMDVMRLDAKDGTTCYASNFAGCGGKHRRGGNTARNTEHVARTGETHRVGTPPSVGARQTGALCPRGAIEQRLTWHACRFPGTASMATSSA